MELEASDYEYLLCDLGTGVIDFVHHWKQVAPSQQGNVFHIVLSHLHWDHLQGVIFFLLSLPANNRVIFYTYHDKTEATVRLVMAPPVFPVSLDQIKAEVSFKVLRPQAPFQVAGYAVGSILQNHPGLSYGYSFQKQGKKIVYSTDCEHPRGQKSLQHPFVQFYSQADVLVFDAMSSFAETEQVGWGHSTYKVGVELATWASAKHLVFIHHDPRVSDALLDTLVPLAQAYYQAYYKVHKALVTPESRQNAAPLQISTAYDGWTLEV
jgi:phosphoribosyl 1,2-cyclic phosphodiesterase